MNFSKGPQRIVSTAPLAHQVSKVTIDKMSERTARQLTNHGIKAKVVSKKK
jgi:hypothetical protein